MIQNLENLTSQFDAIQAPNNKLNLIVGCKHCDGSHAYRNTWSFLDTLIFSKSMGKDGTAAYEFIAGTVEVPRIIPYHLYKRRSTNHFDEKNSVGVLDHFPVYVTI